MAANLEELNLSADELDRFSNAFKDEKFREMFLQYAEEINDPENRRKYEEEISLMEQERGMDIQFIHPQPGHVLLTSIDGVQTCYLNICSNELIQKPECKPGRERGKHAGQHWALPYSLAPGKEDLGKGGNKHMIYDVVFHPDTLYIASKNEKFKKMVDSTALEAVSKQFNVELDHKNVKTLSVKYKGVPQASVLRKPRPGVTQKPEDPNNPLYFPYPYGSPGIADPAGRKTCTKPLKESKLNSVAGDKRDATLKAEATVPHYTIRHRTYVDLQDYRGSRDSTPSPIPKELVITIDLPLVKSSADVSLDIAGKQLSLESETPAYKLQLTLPYPVDENKGKAQFNKAKKQLVITVPVVQENYQIQMQGQESETIEDETNEALPNQLVAKNSGNEESECHSACKPSSKLFCDYEKVHDAISESVKEIAITGVCKSPSTLSTDVGIVTETTSESSGETIGCKPLETLANHDEKTSEATSETTGETSCDKPSNTFSNGNEKVLDTTCNSSTTLFCDGDNSLEGISQSVEKTAICKPSNIISSDDDKTQGSALQSVSETAIHKPCNTLPSNENAKGAICVSIGETAICDPCNKIYSDGHRAQEANSESIGEATTSSDKVYTGKTETLLPVALSGLQGNIDKENTLAESVCPTFTCTQDTTSLTLIIHVKDIEESTIETEVGIDQYQISFSTKHASGHYILILQFQASQKVNDIENSVSISKYNAVIGLTKSSESFGLWEKIYYGNNKDHLQERKFISEETIQELMEEPLQQPLSALTNQGDQLSFEVLEMTEERTHIRISKPETEKEEQSADLAEIKNTLNAELNITHNAAVTEDELQKSPAEDKNTVDLSGQVCDCVEQQEDILVTAESQCEKELKNFGSRAITDQNITNSSVGMNVVCSKAKEEILQCKELDEDDLPDDTECTSTLASSERSSQILKEIQKDGSEHAITDHTAHCAFVFQNSLLYDLD
ncbi:protein kintoun [Bombina bombina]|uniref:protein kintoun n=1 Tax=Bombina bombina TaxID=8345 RepID=UPI00235B1C15|nr:protein kintoun [Bombina bombina]